MLEVWYLATTFPGVVYTVLLGVVLLYWTFVMVGAVDLDDGLGGLDGPDALVAAKGAIEGGAKGAVEGAAKGALESHLRLDLDGDGPDVDPDGPEAGVLAALLSALRLKRVPVTTVLSLLVTFAWLACVVAMQIVTRVLPGATVGLLRWIVLLGSPLAALPLTALAVRPLARVFVERKATKHTDLIGKTCVVRTGKVTGSFGEGTLEDGGAGLVVRVRVDGGKALQRGEHALIVDWDAARDAFVVEPMTQLLDGDPEK